jgi:molybdopterin-guanine dinucleotide biosynthesis protein A
MGTAKTLLAFGPETMLQRVVRLLGEVVSPIVVVAAQDQALPTLPPTVLVVRDEHPEQGPLEGLRRGLTALPRECEAAFVSGCDVPLLKPAFVQQMIDLLEGHSAAVPESDGWLHPLSAVYRRNVLPQVEHLISAGRKGPIDLFDLVKTRRVQPRELSSVDPDLQSLQNVNRPEDYQAALQAAGFGEAS